LSRIMLTIRAVIFNREFDRGQGVRRYSREILQTA
jgi:hypothetical protein